MTNDSSAIVSKVWNYAHVLKNAGGGYGDTVEIAFLLFGSDVCASPKLADSPLQTFRNPPPEAPLTRQNPLQRRVDSILLT